MKMRPKMIRVVGCAVVVGILLSMGPLAYGKEEPLKITFMAPFYQAQPPSMTNGVIARFEEITNTRLDVTWIPDPNFLDKFSLMVAGGDLPMVIRLNNRTWQSGVFLNACRAGLFWEVPPSLLKSFPNLAKSSPDYVLQDGAIDGKNYGIPAGTDTVRMGLIYRKDWLTKVGLKTPATVEDIYTVAKAFTEKDPDGNGKNDTYGFAYIDDAENEQAFAGFDWILVALGGYNKWGVKDGQFVPYWDTPQYLETMQFFKRLYDEKLMNQDFALIKGARKYEPMNQGKAGMMVTTATNLETKYIDLRKAMKVEEKDWLTYMDVMTRLQSPDGKYRLSAISAVNNYFIFSKQKIKTEADLKQVLQFLDATADENGEIRKTWENGIAGKHYEKLDDAGMAVRTEEQKKIFRDENNEIQYLRAVPIRYSDWEKRMANRPLFIYTTRLIMANEPDAVKNPALLYLPLSQTFTTKGKDLEKIISDARVKFIMGQLDEAGFKKEVERWKHQGGDNLIKELSAEYAKSQKK